MRSCNRTQQSPVGMPRKRRHDDLGWPLGPALLSAATVRLQEKPCLYACLRLVVRRRQNHSAIALAGWAQQCHSRSMAGIHAAFEHMASPIDEAIRRARYRRSDSNGAMMATLRCDHPDIEAFIAAKRDGYQLRHFNLSVLVTDEFMSAVEADASWPLLFPEPGGSSLKPTAFRSVSARSLWQNLMRANCDHAEPGVIFIDRVRRLDNVHDISHFPLPQQRKMAQASRRIGLGLTGLADALLMRGVEYGSPASLEIAADMMRTICHAAYRTSSALAREKGAFQLYAPLPYLDTPFVRLLPSDIRAAIARDGMRNSHLTADAGAPTDEG